MHTEVRGRWWGGTSKANVFLQEANSADLLSSNPLWFEERRSAELVWQGPGHLADSSCCHKAVKGSSPVTEGSVSTPRHSASYSGSSTCPSTLGLPWLFTLQQVLCIFWRSIWAKFAIMKSMIKMEIGWWADVILLQQRERNKAMNIPAKACEPYSFEWKCNSLELVIFIIIQ